MGTFRDTHFVLKKYKPARQAVWCTRKFHGIVWNSGRLDYSELPNFLLRDLKREYVAKGTERCKLQASLMDKEKPNLDDHGCVSVQDLVEVEMWSCSRYPFRHKTTLHCLDRKAKLFGNWIMHPLNF